MSTRKATTQTTVTKIGYYVTVQDASKTGFLLGPFPTHVEALSYVALGRDLANLVDGFSDFYAYGTSKITTQKELSPGVLNEHAGFSSALLRSACL
jgi:hypothetical protein